MRIVKIFCENCGALLFEIVRGPVVVPVTIEARKTYDPSALSIEVEKCHCFDSAIEEEHETILYDTGRKAEFIQSAIKRLKVLLESLSLFLCKDTFESEDSYLTIKDFNDRLDIIWDEYKTKKFDER